MVLADVSVSITDELRRQGQDALNAIRLWAEHVERAGEIAVDDGGLRRPLRLILLDDARSLDDDTLLRVARGLQTTTLYGASRLDPVRLRQTGHRGHLVEWRQGRKELVTP